MKNLCKLKQLETPAPAATKAFWTFDQAPRAEGEISKTHKELIVIAVALTIQFLYCIELHVDRARGAAALEPEIDETVLAAALRAGGAITHGTHALQGM